MYGRASRIVLLRVSSLLTLGPFLACPSAEVHDITKLMTCLASVEQLYAFFYSLPSSSSSMTTSHTSTSTSNASTLPLSLAPNETSPSPASPSPSSSNGWAAFNPRSEFARQGLGSRTKAWRFTDINKDYSFCPTYPSKLVVPSRISDSVLSHAGKYRSKGRIPALTYLHWANHVNFRVDRRSGEADRLSRRQ